MFTDVHECLDIRPITRRERGHKVSSVGEKSGMLHGIKFRRLRCICDEIEPLDWMHKIFCPLCRGGQLEVAKIPGGEKAQVQGHRPPAQSKPLLLFFAVGPPQPQLNPLRHLHNFYEVL